MRQGQNWPLFNTTSSGFRLWDRAASSGFLIPLNGNFAEREPVPNLRGHFCIDRGKRFQSGWGIKIFVTMFLVDPTIEVLWLSNCFERGKRKDRVNVYYDSLARLFFITFVVFNNKILLLVVNI